MNEEKTLLTAGEADKLLASADGTVALLYLHILRAGGAANRTSPWRRRHCGV